MKQEIVAQALAQARRLREQFGAAREIRLSVYASDSDLRALRPEDGPEATAEQQRQLVDAVATALRADGHLVKLVTLRAVDYLKWLSENGKVNDPGTRAQWIAWRTNA